MSVPIEDPGATPETMSVPIDESNDPGPPRTMSVPLDEGDTPGREP
ncbi:MAG: hypothetical protein ABWZ82_11455 [Candidatus Limnocylindrales bacterium]